MKLTTLIEWKEANKKLAELVYLQNNVKPMLSQIEKIKKWCKEQGTFNTDLYVCVIEPRKRTGMVSMEEAIEILSLEVIEKLNLSRTSEFLLVHVSKKD